MNPEVNIIPDLPRTVPSSADWSRLRPLVRELYHGRQWSMAQVRDHLQSLGHHVNTRMVRTRISQWDLQRNNRIHTMVAALRLLDPDPALWPSPQPCFLVRGRRVAMSEVLRFFRRRGIQNPVQWCHTTTVERDEPAVSLILEEGSTSGVSSEGGAEHTPPSSSSGSSKSLSLSVASLSPRTSSHISPPPVRLPTPILILTLEQRAVASMRDYCASYLDLNLVTIHQEPEVHQFTTHGRFGDRMQEGLAQMKRRGPNAFHSFSHGFNLVRPILADCHPMTIAQFLATACELLAYSDAQPVVESLLRYSANMAASLRVSPPLVQFLHSLSGSAPALLQRIAIASLRAALDVFTEGSPSTWHGLYLQERLCDCLYHGRDRVEGSVRRERLLTEQEAFYGPFARNVLWTVTNVADDRLDGGDLDGAATYYTMALGRAEHQAGFARAKSRYAALEGLGRVELMRFNRLRGGGGGRAHADRDGCILHLRNAYRHVSGALNEAQVWFEPTSRRAVRASEQAVHIASLVESLDNVTVSPS